ARPMPAADRRWDSPLLRGQNDDAEVTDDGERELLEVIEEAKACAAELGVADFSAFATSALRDARNADELLQRIRTTSDVDLYVPRVLKANDVERLVEKLAATSVKDRAKLPGVSARRADQLLAGAVVAAATMTLLDLELLQICPWALREGIILTRQDWIAVL